MKEERLIAIVAAALIIILVGGIVIGVVTHQNNSTAWEDFADQINKDTDYYLKKETSGTCGYIRTAGNDYSTNLNVSWSSYETNYVKVYAKEGGLALEWHYVTKAHGDKVTSITYVPYDAICYVQANKVA